MIGRVSVESNMVKNKVSGRFDFAMRKALRDMVDKTLAGTRLIEGELSVVDDLDGFASGMLPLSCDTMFVRKGVSLKRAPQDVKKILEIANFDKLFTLP